MEIIFGKNAVLTFLQSNQVIDIYVEYHFKDYSIIAK